MIVLEQDLSIILSGVRPGERRDTKLTTFAFNCRDVGRNGGSGKTTTSQKFQESNYMVHCNAIYIYAIMYTEHEKHVEFIIVRVL